MGAYPGARLVYGIDLGDEEYGEMPEGWDEMEDPEATVKEIHPKLTLEYTGNLYTDYTRYILARHCTTVSAYEAETVTTESLKVDDDADTALRAGFRALFPDVDVPEPRWMITVHYG